MSGLRVLVSAGFTEGHAYPALALARALRTRGHQAVVELSERWREPTEGLGAEFIAAREYVAFPGAHPGAAGPTAADAARELAARLPDLGVDAVVADLVAPAPALAAELAGVPAASLVPTLYPVQGAGAPPFEAGLPGPRSALARAAWRAAEPATRPLRRSARWVRRVPRLHGEVRAQLGLAPLPPGTDYTTYGPIAAGLALVATFPQLEYPRPWPSGVHVVGPMPFELPHPDVALPEGDEPLVLVAASTAQGAGAELVRAALAALADEPIRVVATLNRRGASWDEPVPGNAVVVDWVSYAQVLPEAALAITAGGHGTVARALAEGVPVLVSPVGADAAENGARVAWAGAGLTARRPRALRGAARRALADPAIAARARELAAWARAHDGAAAGAALVEAYARR
jgi:UDP:flavonoid glycosyltransferase YjiC (YdhE family)